MGRRDGDRDGRRSGEPAPAGREALSHLGEREDKADRARRSTIRQGGPAAGGTTVSTGAWIGLAIAASLLVGGCSCNANTSLNQIYCEAYSDSTVGPALVVLGAFLLFTVFAVWLFRRIYRPRSQVSMSGEAIGDGTAVPPPWSVAGLGTRPACDVLDELAATGSVFVRTSESYEGTWLVEVAVPSISPPLEYISPWTTHEKACQLAVDALVDRDLVYATGGGVGGDD
jgi:hypothetical protein